jgi:hypothetical protein
VFLPIWVVTPTKEHLNAALHICRYLAGTRDYRLCYDGKSELGLVAYADSNWNMDPYNSRQLLRTAQGFSPQAVQCRRGFVWDGLSRMERPQSKVYGTLEEESLQAGSWFEGSL